MEIWANISVKMKLEKDETEEQAGIRINQIINDGLGSNKENKIRFNVHNLKLHDDLLKKEPKSKKEKNWYRCTSREEMILLIQAGFDYINFREDKYNDGNITYFFEKNEQLEKYISKSMVSYRKNIIQE